MRILALDTCAPVIGVALLDGQQVLQRSQRVSRGAEALLTPWVAELLAEAGLALTQLDGIAVARGPGAFTGLRVGLATAAGLAQGAALPLWATDSLHSRATAALGRDLPVLAWLDARKGRAYAVWYAADGRRLRHPADVQPQVALSWCSAPFLAVGEGTAVWRAELEAAGGRAIEDCDTPAVAQLAHLAAQGLARGEGADPVALCPLYLRAPDAEPPTEIEMQRRQR